MKLRKINDIHFVITDSNPTTNGDYAIHPITLNFSQHHSKDNNLSEGWKKIEFSTQPLELLTLSENGLSGMGFSKVKPLNIFNVKELIGEVDVENKAKEYYQKNLLSPYHGDTTKQDYIDIAVFFYNQALEDNKAKKYTEEDMRRAYMKGISITGEGFNAEYSDGNDPDIEDQFGKHADNFIQSLQPKTEWEVEIVDGKFKLK